VWSVGWWLSVGATGGIAFVATPLAARLPGPRSLAGAVAVTLSAQLGVTPVSLAVFGGVPLVAVLANVLAVPVAGPVMVWGLPAGLAAGFLPPAVATAVHVPTRLGVRWIALVARLGAAAPVGQIRPVHVPFLLTAAAVVLLARRRRRSRSWSPERPSGR
jgi:competence protein ComEC